MTSLGTIEVSESLIVTDPCYIPNDLYHGQLTEKLLVLPGTYECSIETSNRDGWGNRVASLSVDRIGSQAYYRQFAATVGVDSGQMMFLSGDALERWKDEGFTLYGRYEQGLDNDQHVGRLSYNGACLATLSQQAGILADKAVVSSTGYGDGTYEVWCRLDADDNIVGAEVIFIEMSEAEEEDPADNDEFICEKCGDTWDIEDSTRATSGLLICPECKEEDDE